MNMKYEVLVKLLEEVEHELVIAHGLYVHDGDPAHVWRLNYGYLIEKIDECVKSLRGQHD